MKTIKAYTYLLLGIALSLMCACSEEIFSPTTVEGEDVNLTPSYSDVSPREITVTRASDAEERHLNNLYIYIFDGSGKLKGFKQVTSENELDQSTSSTSRATISGIKTKAGASYIYAVANINTGLYPVTCSEGSVADGKLPVGLDEDKAQAGDYADFTLEKLKDLSFVRNDKNTIQISSAFLMSGAVNEGNEVNINTNGTIDGNNTDNDIRLSRIVSKVKFTIKAKTGDNVTRSFKVSSYDIMNIALNGKLVGKIDGNIRETITDSKNVSDIKGFIISPNDVEKDGTEFFECYLPENLQNAKATASNWQMREDDNQSKDKSFTNAPEYGTYVVLKGRYEETKEGTTRSADVKYYIHLGDCSTNFNDYDVERNCKYTFKVTVAGVNKIIVEAEKQGNEQPGAEGVVLEYSTGKNMLLDSHYEYMVMRFYQNDIKKLKELGRGYYYQVYALGQHTDVMNVGNTTTGETNKVDTSWIQFAIEKDNTKSAYSSDAKNRGTACDYPNRSDIDKMEDGKGLYTINKFLKLLYDKADDANFWTGGTNGNKYIDATCFVDENYYQDLTWDKYVNDVDKRKFYVANTVETSDDGRSVYAKVQYGLSQYNIQTFYDRSKSGSVVAYGCETINDEEGMGHTGTNASVGSDRWNGRNNFVKDYKDKSEFWSSYKDNTDLKYDCMSRNRDLNGDGKITEDEVRWYVPTSAQYGGLWIGEDILSTEAKLFNKSTDVFTKYSAFKDTYNGRMLYYTNTKGEESYWSEEGMATGGPDAGSSYVRCVRNLKSKNIGYDSKPDTYYSWESSSRLITLDKVDTGALNVTGETGELIAHNERQDANKPASKFYVAEKNIYEQTKKKKNWEHTGPTQKAVVEGTYTCAKNYTTSDGKKWRVPNQREYCLMFIVAGNNSSGFVKSDLVNTYVKTNFSGQPFRYSWNYDGTNLNMAKKTDTAGYIRCISPAK